MKRWAVALVVLVGCGKSKAQCRSEVHDLMAFLHAMDHTQRFADRVELVARPEAPPFTDLPSTQIVVMKPDAILYRGVRTTAAALGEQLTTGFARLHDDPRIRRRVALVIDAKARWDRVVEVAQAVAGAGFDQVSFVFDKPSPVAPPPRSSVDAKLDALLAGPDNGNQAVQVAKLAAHVIDSCAPLKKVFGSVAEADDQGAFVIEGIGKALPACDCDVDVPALRSIMWRVAGNPHPSREVVVTLAKNAAQLVLPAATSWRDASPKLHAGPVWPVSAP